MGLGENNAMFVQFVRMKRARESGGSQSPMMANLFEIGRKSSIYRCRDGELVMFMSRGV